MVQIRLHPHRDQLLLLEPSVKRTPPTAPATRPEPGVASHVLFDLRNEDAVYASLAAARTALLVPIHRPASGLPAMLAEAQHVMRSRDLAFEAVMAEDREASAGRYADLAAATWMDEAVGQLLAEKTHFVLATLTAHPELLPVAVAQLKGLVA